MRSRRRYWELRLLFSLLLKDQIMSGSDTLPHHWVMLLESTTSGVHTAYVNEGYMVGGDFTDLANNFFDPAEQVAKERMRHGSITTTERYLHTLPTADETALTALSNIRNRS